MDLLSEREKEILQLRKELALKEYTLNYAWREVKRLVDELAAKDEELNKLKENGLSK